MQKAGIRNFRIQQEQENETMVENIGGRLRRVRKSRDMTLSDLAMRAGLSVSYISNLERDLCSPTLDNLNRICAVLDVSLIKLLDSADWNEGVIRAEEREAVTMQSGQIRYESIHFGPDKFNGVVITLEPQCICGDDWRHDYDEIGLILEGELTIHINGNEYVLREGDSVYVGARDEHNLSNHSDRKCVSYWVKRGE